MLHIKVMSTKKPVKIKTFYNDGDTLSAWRESLNDIIFGSETPMGKAFDIVLSICILLSVAVVMMGSVDAFQKQHSHALYGYISRVSLAWWICCRFCPLT
ncbi:MAG: hypothetical protein LUQ56_05140 [Methylococcaceae bacterium]|nr:hypothetical protein [Methylococcaceae bacterium]